MKEMNSETHSCTHSLASLDTLAVVGSEFFMIRDTLAICCQLAIPAEVPLRTLEKFRTRQVKTRKVKEVKRRAGKVTPPARTFLQEPSTPWERQ